MPKKDNARIFNGEQKQEYIRYEEVNAKALRQYFQRIAPIEETYNKDISDMSIEEIKTTLISLSIRPIASRGHIISLLKGYIDWCIFNGKTINENKLDNIKPEDIGSQYSIKTQMLKNAEQLEYIIETAFVSGYYEQNNRKKRDSLVLWLMYAGMKIEELSNLKKTDINYEKRIVYSPINPDNEYSVDDNVISLWESCIEMTYIEKSGARQEKNIFKYELVDNNYLFRVIAGKNPDHYKKMSASYFAGILYRIFKIYFEDTGEYILVSPYNIRMSGIFYRMYLYEQSGLELTTEIVCKYLNIKCLERSEMAIKSRKYRIDYADWKEAFGY